MDNTQQKKFPFEIIILNVLLVLASVLLIMGLITPMMTISKFIIFDSSFSVVSGIMSLFHNQQYILFVVIGIFSIVIPIIKILLLFTLLALRERKQSLNKILHLMHEYGRWAMLDVMVVAVLIVTVKLGALVSVQVHSGLYIFGAAVLLIMIITHRVVRIVETKNS